MPNGSPPTLEWTTIPPELWHCAITYASNADQRAFLAVSRFFRAAAHRVIFRVVYLQFGVWESIRPDDESDEEDTEDFAVSTARRTRELTERIAHDAAFAQAVQSLHVLAYTMQQGLDPEDMQSLIGSVHALPHLQSFSWIGNWPHLPIDVAKVLSARCPNLRRLRIPATHATYQTPLHLQFSHLTTLAILCQIEIDNVHGYWPDRVTEGRHAMQALINRNHHLVRLTIYSALVDFIEPHIFGKLVEFEVWLSQSGHITGLRRLLPFGHRLERLALVELTQTDHATPILLEHCLQYPNLTALKIISTEVVQPSCARDLAAIIRLHPSLRRIDLDLPGMAAEEVHEIVAAICTLAHLDTLAMDMRALSEIEDFASFSDALPRTIVALHLQLRFENLPLDEPEMRTVLNAFAEMPDLRLLHLQTLYATGQAAAEELARALPGIELIGLGQPFWDVHRSSGLLRLREKTPKQVAMRTSETFGEEGEWYV